MAEKSPIGEKVPSRRENARFREPKFFFASSLVVDAPVPIPVMIAIDH
jgi:hypothetical protein